MLVLLTGCRPGEIASINRDQLDGNVLTLTNTKNSKTHTVYLSRQAMEIVGRRDSPYLFPMMSRSHEPMRPGAVSRLLGLALPKLRVMKFSPHDLRRSCATGMARLRVPRHIISLVLNHSTSDITSVYDVHGYADELAEAWSLWGAHIESLSQPAELRKTA